MIAALFDSIPLMIMLTGALVGIAAEQSGTLSVVTTAYAGAVTIAALAVLQTFFNVFDVTNRHPNRRQVAQSGD